MSLMTRVAKARKARGREAEPKDRAAAKAREAPRLRAPDRRSQEAARRAQHLAAEETVQFGQVFEGRSGERVAGGRHFRDQLRMP